MFSKNCFGVDLGTSAVKIYSLRKNRMMIEHNILAIRDGEQVIAVGNDAYEMYEKNPPSIEVVRPIVSGRIANIQEAEILLRVLLRKTDRRAGGKPRLFFSAPLNMSEIERRAFYSLSTVGNLKSPRIYLTDRPICDALSLGIDLRKTRGSMIINIGAENTEISVIAGGQIIVSDTISFGGQLLNDSIANEIRRSRSMLIGQRTSTRLKAVLATFENPGNDARKVVGIDTLSGLPKEEVISSDVVSTAVEAEFHRAAETLRNYLERMPPQVARCIRDEGIYLTGGTARIPALDRYLSRIIGCKINISPDYEFSTVKGLQEIIQHRELQKWVSSREKS